MIKNSSAIYFVQLVRETLTTSNVPHGDCAICLCDFLDESRQFIRTECYHYFHASCMSKYQQHWLREQKEKSETREKLPVYQLQQEEQV